jgi:hypothetical protein
MFSKQIVPGLSKASIIGKMRILDDFMISIDIRLGMVTFLF